MCNKMHCSEADPDETRSVHDEHHIFVFDVRCRKHSQARGGVRVRVYPLSAYVERHAHKHPQYPGTRADFEAQREHPES